ncbi:hypothetical protein AAT19DRAFT_15742 [Rhodotorula toruloides]|uniref:Uncharacterized protein n=1 Tax=Rhodotorula toruloides TaxID=5286 RepID=A0A2T0A4P2_RHOTO|nr:hypothetical protein AAT19DRAFT_15742 [Rhodotorula toruloides]
MQRTLAAPPTPALTPILLLSNTLPNAHSSTLTSTAPSSGRTSLARAPTRPHRTSFFAAVAAEGAAPRGEGLRSLAPVEGPSNPLTSYSTTHPPPLTPSKPSLRPSTAARLTPAPSASNATRPSTSSAPSGLTNGSPTALCARLSRNAFVRGSISSSSEEEEEGKESP